MNRRSHKRNRLKEEDIDVKDDVIGMDINPI